MDILKMSEEHVEECTDLYIDAFTKSPWHDAYDSRAQVVSFFQNHMANNYFLGYVLKGQTGIAALCIGMKKPWIQGTEYYIDQFCVKPEGCTVGECRGRRRNKQRKHRQGNERRTGRSFLLSFGQDTYGKQTVFGPRRIGRRRKRAAPPA